MNNNIIPFTAWSVVQKKLELDQNAFQLFDHRCWKCLHFLGYNMDVKTGHDYFSSYSRNGNIKTKVFSEHINTYENGCGRWQFAACSCLHCKLIYIVLYTHWRISFLSVSDPFEHDKLSLTMDGSQEIEMEEKPTLKTIPRGKEDLEDIFIALGGFGNYQKRLFCLLVVFLFAAMPLLQNTQARSSVCWWSLLEESLSGPNFGISDFLKVNRSVTPFQST